MGFLGAIAGEAVGQAIGSMFGRSNAKYSMGLSKDLWTYQQSNAHQLEVQDLKAAGLNPILSATNSQIASTPSAPSIDKSNGLSDAVSALQVASLKKDVQLKQLELDKGRFALEREKMPYEIAAMGAEAYNKRAQAGLFSSQRDYTKVLSKGFSAKNAAEIKEINTRIDTMLTKLPYEIDNIMSSTSANYAMVNQMAAAADAARAAGALSKKQAEEINTRLSDPKSVATKEWFKKVLDPNNKEYELVRRSFYRGLENDILFSFGSSDSANDMPRDLLSTLRDLATIGRGVKGK
ncbi:VP2 [Gokushovirus WZ-2015a]|nr:VP2 [Gokushovirus WZ-2015a]